MTSTDDLNANLSSIESAFQKLEHGTRLVLIPENALYFRLNKEPYPTFQLSDSFWSRLAVLAKNYSCFIHIGSAPLEVLGKRRNASVWVSPEGEIFSHYQKIHLFDVTVDGEHVVRESEVFSPGDGPSVINVDGWKIGESICYDLRFSELFLYYAKAEVDLVLIPAAFLVTTGAAHWNILVRARAIEGQFFVAAAGQVGLHRSSQDSIGPNTTERRTFGHSLVVDPWGREILSLNGHSSELGQIELSKAEISRVRQQIPMRSHRRL